MNDAPGLNIVQACGSRSWGGLEMQALQTASGLRERGHHLWMLCPQGSTLEKESRSQGFKTLPILDAYQTAGKSFRKIAGFFRSENIDVVHTHLSHDLIVLTPALRISRSFAGFFLTKHMASGIKKRTPVHRWLYSRLDRIFSISNYIRGSVINTCPVSAGKVSVLFNGIDLSQYDTEKWKHTTLRNQLKIGEYEIVIGIIGRISRGKGHIELFQAARLLRKRMSRPLKFIVVGGPSRNEESLYQEIRARAKELLSTADIIFAGQQNNIPEYMAIFDILAFPSHEESFGVVLIEAMAMGLPLVACDSGGVPDIVLPDKTGLLVPPRDHVALADALEKLISNPGLALAMGSAGRKRVEEHFSFNAYIDALLEHYNSHKSA